MKKNSSVLDAYLEAVRLGKTIEDENQKNIIHDFDAFKLAFEKEMHLQYQRWHRVTPIETLMRQVFNLHKKPAMPNLEKRGIYLWGGVGRGKTFIMDLFYEALPLKEKRRFHYHHLMHWVHSELKAKQGEKDPLDKVARTIAKEAAILCIDEFFVTDIGDAMILSRFLEALFDHGVSLVITSNLQPAHLYRNGLQRQRFLPAIRFIETYLQVVSFDEGQDYRQRVAGDGYVFFIEQNKVDSEKSLQQLFNDKVSSLFSVIEEPIGLEKPVNLETTIVLHGRSVACYGRIGGVIWFSFQELCGSFRSQLDYVDLAKVHHTIFLSDIPQLTGTEEDQARRFIYLIDALYDYNVVLVASFDVALSMLYQGSGLVFEFERVLSRLTEMKTVAYLSRPHRGIGS